MASYNIQLRTKTHVRETLKYEGADYTALKVEVARFVGEMLKEHANEIWVDEDWRVDVTDAKGMILYTMHVSAAEASATMSRST